MNRNYFYLYKLLILKYYLKFNYNSKNYYNIFYYLYNYTIIKIINILLFSDYILI